MKSRIRLGFVLAALLAAVSGCSIVKEYRQADGQTYNAVCTEYIQYLNADATVAPAMRAARLVECGKWKARIEDQAEIRKDDELALYGTIAREYLAYVDSDAMLTPEQKARRKRTCFTWKLRIDKGAP